MMVITLSILPSLPPPSLSLFRCVMLADVDEIATGNSFYKFVTARLERSRHLAVVSFETAGRSKMF